MARTFEAVRAEALFVSCLQPSQHPAGGEVRTEVAAILRGHGIRGCAAAVAAEFGHHPDCAVARMAWALSTIRTVYPAASAATKPSRAA
jgi:hypothetical protein